MDPVDAALAAPGYPEFRARLRESGCRRCRLARGRTRIVVDRGNPDAPVLAVGEAPGAAEDASGVAFRGRAGQVLDGLLRGAGLSPDRDLLIVNVVKCRPPANRTPRWDEVEACRPLLRRQLALSPAETILVLGATALRRLDPARARRPLGPQVGRSFRLPDYPGRRFLILYHPAALLYNASLRPAAERHFRALADSVRNPTGTA